MAIGSDIPKFVLSCSAVEALTATLGRFSPEEAEAVRLFRKKSGASNCQYFKCLEGLEEGLKRETVFSDRVFREYSENRARCLRTHFRVVEDGADLRNRLCSSKTLYGRVICPPFSNIIGVLNRSYAHVMKELESE